MHLDIDAIEKRYQEAPAAWREGTDEARHIRALIDEVRVLRQAVPAVAIASMQAQADAFIGFILENRLLNEYHAYAMKDERP